MTARHVQVAGLARGGLDGIRRLLLLRVERRSEDEIPLGKLST
jgi:hypothetical protein